MQFAHLLMWDFHSSPIQVLGNPEFWGCDEKCQETHRCEKKVSRSWSLGGVAVTLLKKLRVLEGKVT